LVNSWKIGLSSCKNMDYKIIASIFSNHSKD
jgi:hypothetical protein